ncbi:MAG TPA: dihydrodipicolinate synthase family protein [Anaerolineae bacterium]|nr:dihydrodipicolinate synthase family protein [Anaerolineae bacterium]
MTTTTISLSGVFPPIPTPFDGEGRVDLAALAANLGRWNQCGLAGYVVLGSNGEPVYVDEQEKIEVWQAARAVIPSDKLMIAGTGCESTEETIHLTRVAADAGADAALVVTPHYYSGQMTRQSLLHHYRTVADSSSIPVLLYNVPKFTNVDLDAATVAEASPHPNLIGIKDSSGNIAKLGDFIRLASPGFQVLVGTGAVFFAGLALGAVGGILALANVAPRECVDILGLYEGEQWDEAAELQRRLLPVNAAVTARFGIAGLKAALDLLGYYGGPVRSPLLDLGAAERDTVRGILAEAGLL